MITLPYAVRERHKISCLRVQAVFRGNRGRKKASEKRSCIIIQAYIRGWRVRRHLDEVVFGWATYDYAVQQLKKHCKDNNMTLHQLFDELDIDQDETIAIEELQQFFIDHPSLNLDKDEITALVYHLDHNQDHNIGLKEFIHSMLKHDKKLEKIKNRWEKHQALKRKRASDFQLMEMKRNREHVQAIQNKANSASSELRLNLAQMSHFRKMVRKHREEHEQSKIRKQRRLLDGHLTYRQEAEINHRRYHVHIRSAKSRALEALRVSNRREHNELGPTQTKTTTRSPSQQQQPTSPKGRRPRRGKPSPRNKNVQLSNMQRKAKSWKKIFGDNGEPFYQNIVTLEVEWDIPKNGVLYDPAMEMQEHLWGDCAAPDFQAVFENLPSKTWYKKASNKRRKNTNEWNMSGEELEALSDGVLGISSLRFDQDKDRWFGPSI